MYLLTALSEGQVGMDCSLLRNIGFMAHIDAGKTTLSERVLFYSDTIHRMGEVHDGSATMDFMPEEQERGITISSACITCMWKDHVINLVDTPGHVDFTVEVERCLRVLDAAVGIFCAVGGVEPQSETVWKQADAFGIPRLAVINKMDRPGASYSTVLDAMRNKLNVHPVAVVVPLGEGENFRGVLDIVRKETVTFDKAALGKEICRNPFTDEEAALAAPWCEALVDVVTMEDDALLEQCLRGVEPSVDVLESVLRKLTLERKIVPVFAASALRNMGVQPILDGVRSFLPSPMEVPPAQAYEKGSQNKEKGTRKQNLEEPTEARGVTVEPRADSPVCALVFKVTVSDNRKIVFLRLYAGTLHEGDSLYNTRSDKTERAMRLYRLHADQRENLKQASVGDIVAVQGLKDARTGDTVVSGGPHLLLEPLRSWRPVISLAFEPKNAEEGERLDAALAAFTEEDPTLSMEINDATDQRIVSGMGELHLEVLADRMRREWNITPRIGNPQVVCRETIKNAAEADGEFDKELGGQLHYGRVKIHVAPAERSSGNSIIFAQAVTEQGDFSSQLVEAVEHGIRDACFSGPSGYLVEDVAVTVLELGRKQGLATAPGLHMAAQHALRSALAAAGPLVLEPLMRVDVTVPENFLGSVISLLNTRGARVENLGEQHDVKLLQALAPMRGLFGFATALRSATQGRAGLVMQFLRFDAAR